MIVKRLHLKFFSYAFGSRPYGMELSGDYTDNDETLDGLAPSNEYSRPIFVRKRPVSKLRSKPSKRVAKPKSLHDQTNTSHSTSDTIASPIIFKSGTFNLEGNIEKQKSNNNFISNERKSVRPELYEYGKLADGFGFIGTKAEYEKWLHCNFRSNSPCLSVNDSEDEAVDIFAFDQNHRNPSERLLKSNNLIMKYWEHDISEIFMLPIMKNCDINDIDMKEITRISLEEFYHRSCTLLNRDMASILKKERIFWHPDKMIKKTNNDKTKLNKITKVFQIINDMWESL